MVGSRSFPVWGVNVVSLAAKDKINQFRCESIREFFKPSEPRPHRLQILADAQVKTCVIKKRGRIF